MSKPSRRPSFREFARPIPHDLWIGFLTAIGVLRLPSHAGAYWAQKQTTMVWELRVPYRPGRMPF
jgi:hypothetical protein